MRDIWLSSRIGATLGMLGMLNVKEILHRVRRHKWIDGELRPVDRRVLDTDAFGRSFDIIPYEYPYLERIVRYLFFRPRRFTIQTAVKRLASVFGISEREAREHLDRAFALDYLKIEEVETYPERYWSLLVVKVVSEREGELSFTDLRRELTKYGISFRRAFYLIFEALDKGWIDEIRGKYYTTNAGREALAELPKPKVRKLIVVSKSGREFIRM